MWPASELILEGALLLLLSLFIGAMGISTTCSMSQYSDDITCKRARNEGSRNIVRLLCLPECSSFVSYKSHR